MHDIEYIMVDIVNQNKKLEELMLEIVNNKDFPAAVIAAVEGDNGDIFTRLCNEVCEDMAREIMHAGYH